MSDDRILAIDIGAGTMDVLLYDPAQSWENAVQLVLPSATAIAGNRIAAAREAGRDVFLHGNLMGGYHTTNAVWRHLEAGLRVYATERAAGTVHDDLELLRSRGIVITDHAPNGAVPIELRDLDLDRLAGALAPYDVTLPPTVAVAAQDHGFSPKRSNRLFRFEHWRRLLTPGSTLADHIWREPPEYLTRLRAIQADAPGAIVADTGPAAVLGALEDELVAQAARLVLRGAARRDDAVRLFRSRPRRPRAPGDVRAAMNEQEPRTGRGSCACPKGAGRGSDHLGMN
ncbi:MAG: hypothetical protein E6I48_10410 [Chloroflexi bacterium]|nr:MAG: hypothetical protein E6I48_10410 [Chloroflexota bacterium]